MTIDGTGRVPPPPRTVRRAEALRTQVRDAIEDLIVYGTLQPGERLAETTLAERLEVSRQPVREALSSLAGIGFIDLTPGRGARVHAPTMREVREAFHVRALLEADSCELAARTIDDAGVTELHRICDEGDGAAGRDDARRLIELNGEFHRTITRISGNTVTASLLDQLQRRINWYLATVIVDRSTSSWDEHRGLVTVLEDHDAESARVRMLAHVHHSLDSIELRQG